MALYEVLHSLRRRLGELCAGRARPESFVAGGTIQGPPPLPPRRGNLDQPSAALASSEDRATPPPLEVSDEL